MAANDSTPTDAVSPDVSGGQVEITRRLYRTTDDHLVGEGHPDGAFLYATPGMRIPVSEAERYGLLPATPATTPTTASTSVPVKARRKTARPAGR